MKKFLFVLLAVAISISVFAQTESMHLTFKGVPIDGTLNQFVTSMRAKGFTGTVNRDGTAVLEGDFAGYKGCKIFVSTLQNKDIVSTIGVLIPECPNWKTLESNYRKLQEMLTTKYGTPVEVMEEFQHPRDADDDSSNFHELKMDRCNYSTLFRSDKGELILKLISYQLDCYVYLGYFDKTNGMAVDAAAMDDL